MHLNLACTRRNNQFRNVYIPNRWLKLLTVPDLSMKMAAAGGVEEIVRETSAHAFQIWNIIQMASIYIVGERSVKINITECDYITLMFSHLLHGHSSNVSRELHCSL